MSGSGAHPAVLVKGVGKRFRIGTLPATGGLVGSLRRSLHLGDAGASEPRPEVWALRDVNLEVPAGRVLGVIGRNGSGKTTLMKIIARVTAPTEGVVETRGRVGAMLKVGTGFHPELSGRDNIALSGAILGMSRQEIAAVEDGIIRFAEIDRFLDTPVKHYSSGMHVRLAFGVSSHMPASIMIIDEVLSVGDGPFQKRCQGRISAMVEEGRTVLFVSHNMNSVRTLCEDAVVLDAGNVRFSGDVDSAIRFYEEEILGEPRSRESRLGGDGAPQALDDPE